MKPTLQLYCRKHGFVETDMDRRCPACHPRDLGIAMAIWVPAIGLGFALGLGLGEVLKWVF